MIISIGICTRNRNDLLEKAILSVFEHHKIPDHQLHLIIVDNHADGLAEPIFNSLSSKKPNHITSMTYAIEPRQGIAFARNKVLQIAEQQKATYIAFFDDDATVKPNWLTTLLSYLHKYKAAIVAGPQPFTFPHDAPSWALKSWYFRPRSVPDGSTCQSCSTGNVLFKREITYTPSLTFNERAEKAGGTDMEFFLQATNNGHKIVWCSESLIDEAIEPERLCYKWVLQRGYSYGNTAARACINAHGPVKGRLLSLYHAARYGVYGAFFMPFKVLFGKNAFIDCPAFLLHSLGFITGIFKIKYQTYASR